MTSDGGRRSYLLNGRRVGVRDLLEADMVEPGDHLTFLRQRSGDTHVAVIAKSGELLVDGVPYATPSRAAAAATNGSSIDGWTAWATRTGTLLHTLRLQLLDRVAAETPSRTSLEEEDQEPEPDEFLSRHDFLKEVRGAVERGEVRKMIVRDLVRLYKLRHMLYVIRRFGPATD